MRDKIITIGLAPAWDKTIELSEINWNEHKVISSQKLCPAGKALNINKALCWMGIESTAAGLWGSDDYAQMNEICRVGFSPRGKSAKINIALTKTPGRTRENITIVDIKNKRQMHLRSQSTLANPTSLKALKSNLQKKFKKNTFAVFAGAMSDNAIELIELAKKKNTNVVVDTSGSALKKIVNNGGLFLIKPNIEELSEITGRPVVSLSNQKEIILASKKLLNKTKMILVSRGEKGAMLIYSDMSLRGRKAVAISAKYTGKKYPVYNTVACGDYLLAGFLSVIANEVKQSQSIEQLCASALRSPLISATAKAFELNVKFSWQQVLKKINIKVFKR